MESSKKTEYRSIKIREKHYLMVREIKDNKGTPIEFFVGKAIENQYKKEKNNQSK